MPDARQSPKTMLYNEIVKEYSKLVAAEVPHLPNLPDRDAPFRVLESTLKHVRMALILIAD